MDRAGKVAGVNDVYTTKLDDKAPHLRVGLSVRQVGVGFHFSAPTHVNSALGGRNFRRTRTSGPGNVGLFTGGTGAIRYQNGSVGLATGSPGEAFTTTSGGQLTDPGRPFPGLEDFPLRQVEFNSTERSITTQAMTGSIFQPMGTSGLSSEDEEIAVGPYVHLFFHSRRTVSDS